MALIQVLRHSEDGKKPMSTQTPSVRRSEAVKEGKVWMRAEVCQEVQMAGLASFC